MHVTEVRLSGNKRYRVERRLFGRDLVVLQLEWEGTQTYSDGGGIQIEPVTVWRDARPEDIMACP